MKTKFILFYIQYYILFNFLISSIICYSLNAFFIYNIISNKEIIETTLVKQLISYSIKEIQAYFSSSEKIDSYGKIPIHIFDQVIHLKTQFFTDYIINPEFIEKFLKTLEWKILIDNYKTNMEELFYEVISQYCKYIKTEEKQYYESRYSKISVSEIIKAVEPYLNQHKSQSRRYQLNKLNILYAIDWKNYIRTVDFQKNDMIELQKVYHKELPPLNQLLLLQHDMIWLYNHIKYYIYIEINRDTIWSLKAICSAYKKYNNPQLTFDNNPHAISFTIPIEDHIITPATRNKLRNEFLVNSISILFSGQILIEENKFTIKISLLSIFCLKKTIII